MCFCLKTLQFGLDIVSQNVKVTLFLTSSVKTEAAHFAFDFPLVCLVSIILGAGRGKFDNVIACIKFTGKFAEIIAQGKFWLARFPQVNDGICVEVLGLLRFKHFECPIQF